MTQDYLNSHLLHKRVCLGQRAFSEHAANLPDKEYIITGCQLIEGGIRVGLMACDFSPENKQWFDLVFCRECMENLHETFIVQGNYDPIDSDGIFWLGESKTEGDKQALTVTRFLRFKSPENPVSMCSPISFPVNPGDAVYQVEWVATDGKRWSRAWSLELSQLEGKTDKEIDNMMEWTFRTWIRAGMYYHHTDPRS